MDESEKIHQLVSLPKRAPVILPAGCVMDMTGASRFDTAPEPDCAARRR
jgi:hypothetical protein